MEVGLSYTEEEADNITFDSVESGAEFARQNLDEVISFIRGIVDDDLTSFTVSYLARKTSYSEATYSGFVSVCATNELLTAFIKIRCPECSADHGTYYYKSNIPQKTEVCFSCENQFKLQHQQSWNVRYTFDDRPEKK